MSVLLEGRSSSSFLSGSIYRARVWVFIKRLPLKGMSGSWFDKLGRKPKACLFV